MRTNHTTTRTSFAIIVFAALAIAALSAYSPTIVEAAMYPFNVNIKVSAQGEPGVGSANMPDVANILRYRIVPANASVTGAHVPVALTAAAQTVTSGIIALDVPRVVSVTGNTGGIAGNVTITGNNIAQETITNVIALSGASTVSGTKAFKSITSIALPARTHGSGDTVSVGTVNVFGIPHKLHSTQLFITNFDYTDDSGGSFTGTPTVLETNLYTLSGTPNGLKPVDLLYWYVKD